MTRRVREARILVVDDEPVIRETLCQVLTSEGYTVDQAADGVLALECVHAARPDLIVLNLMMPRMDGLQCLRALRAEPAYANVPVIMTTQLSSFTVDPARLGDTQVIYVPFDIGDLLNRIDMAVYRSREPDKSHTQPMPAASESPLEKDRGVVILCEHDRHRLQHLDGMLTGRGFTVVSMTRALIQLSRLAHALRPRAILLEWVSEGVPDVVRELGTATCYVDALIPILVFSRTGGTCPPGTLEQANDAELVGFVETISTHGVGALYKVINDSDTLEVDVTESRLLAAIAQCDDVSRVVYADWLEERGKTARAEFLRTLEVFATTTVDDPMFRERSDRMRELSAAVDARWRYKILLPLIMGPNPQWVRSWCWGV